jgi:hypothetical protein
LNPRVPEPQPGALTYFATIAISLPCYFTLFNCFCKDIKKRLID